MMRPRLAAVTCTALLLGSCSGGGIVDDLVGRPTDEFASPGRSILIGAGGELRLTIRNVGPGEYSSPPEMQGGALRFLDVSDATVQVPAGPTQVFRFVGATRGTTVVRFHSTGSASMVADTVIVQ